MLVLANIGNWRSYLLIPEVLSRLMFKLYSFVNTGHIVIISDYSSIEIRWYIRVCDAFYPITVCDLYSRLLSIWQNDYPQQKYLHLSVQLFRHIYSTVLVSANLMLKNRSFSHPKRFYIQIKVTKHFVNTNHIETVSCCISLETRWYIRVCDAFYPITVCDLYSHFYVNLSKANYNQ